MSPVRDERPRNAKIGYTHDALYETKIVTGRLYTVDFFAALLALFARTYAQNKIIIFQNNSIWNKL